MMFYGIIVILIGLLGSVALAMALAMVVMTVRFNKSFQKEKVFFTSVFIFCLIILLVII